MVALLLLLLVLAVFFGGFAIEVLFWVAAILLILWLAGWFVRPTGRRWYYW
ncbi:MAG TPA: hydrophobic protein [Actinomycetota bacterium]